MKVLLTGGTGFIGGAIARSLRARGDDVVAIVRTPAKAQGLLAIGCTIAAGDVTDKSSIARATKGCDAMIHGAAQFELGVKDPSAMEAATVGGTRNALEAAWEAKIPRIVDVSSAVVFGPSRSLWVQQQLPACTEETPFAQDHRSHYERTKRLAHGIAMELIGKGAPILVAMPSVVYGPGDTSITADTFIRALHGKLPAMIEREGRFSWVHVDDCAAAILAILDRGRIGASYIAAAEEASMEKAMRIALAKAIPPRTPPKRNIPVIAARILAKAVERISWMRGRRPWISTEAIDMIANVDWVVSGEKLRSELGVQMRSLEDGMTGTVAWMQGQTR